ARRACAVVLRLLLLIVLLAGVVRLSLEPFRLDEDGSHHAATEQKNQADGNQLDHGAIAARSLVPAATCMPVARMFECGIVVGSRGRGRIVKGNRQRGRTWR